jgi:hypothetical protein
MHVITCYLGCKRLCNSVGDRCAGKDSDTCLDQLSFTGGLNSIDQQIEKLKAIAAGGCTEIALRVHDDPSGAIQLIGEQVMLAVR